MINTEMLKNNETIHAFDSHTGEYLRTFANYDELVVTWRSAEIVCIERSAYGMFGNEGWFVYC